MSTASFISPGLSIDLKTLEYIATWDASTNTPALADGVGVKNNYYVVSVDGDTNVDGETNWRAGDWILFNGTVWQKIDNTALESNIVDTVLLLPDPTTLSTGTQYTVTNDTVANNGTYIAVGAVGGLSTNWEKA